jgi:hypothetical protein
MTSANYVNKLTSGTLTLVKDFATLTDEATIGEDEYFVLMFCSYYKSFLRNYVQYKNSFNYNTHFEVYDIDINKDAMGSKYYISKTYNNIRDPRGRIIIVNVNDLTKCLDISDTPEIEQPSN